MDVFVSYSVKDKPFFERLRDNLASKEIRLWSFEDEIKPGELWVDEIKTAIEKANAFLVILSSNSLDSNWLRSEVAFAISEQTKGKSKMIIPIVIDKNIYKKPNSVPFFLRDIQWVDLSDKEKYEKNIDALARVIKDSSINKNNDTSHLNAKSEFIKAQTKMFEQERLAYSLFKERRMIIINVAIFTTLITSIIVALSTILLAPQIEFIRNTKLSDFLSIIIGFISGATSSLLASKLYDLFNPRNYKNTRDVEAKR